MGRRTSNNRGNIISIVVMAGIVAGCAPANPVDGPTGVLTAPEELQRQRTIAPLQEVDEERRGEMAPTVVEMYLDDDRRIGFALFPYVVLDPTEPARDDVDDPEEDLEEVAPDSDLDVPPDPGPE